MDQEGTIIGSEFKRFSARTNLDAQLKSWLKMSLSVTYSDTKDDLKLADSDEGLIGYSLTTIPSIPIYNVDGTYSSVSQEGYTNPNPIAMAMMDDILLKRQKLNGNIFFEVTPIENLVWHAGLGFDLGWNKGETYEPMVDLGTWKRSSNGHWIMVASRRDDGNFCRVYFSYFHDGKVEKAFMLPQEDPEYNTFLLKSYNRPEFMVEPVRISVDEFSRAF